MPVPTHAVTRTMPLGSPRAVECSPSLCRVHAEIDRWLVVLLSQHSAKSDPMGGTFVYAVEFKSQTSRR
jgi:hypothetical protein